MLCDSISRIGSNSVGITINTQTISDMRQELADRKSCTPMCSEVDKALTNFESYQGADFSDIGCKVESNSFVKINTFDAQDLVKVCDLPSKSITKTYYFGSEGNIVTVTFGGSPEEYDKNLSEFENAVKTIKIDKPVAMKTIIAQVNEGA